MTKTRVFFVSDIHGSDRLFFKLLSAAKVYKAQVLIIGGDIAGKAISPIFKSDGSHYEAEFQGTEREANNKEELEKLFKETRALGNYPYVTSRKEWIDLIEDERNMERVFDGLIKESAARWCILAKERLEPLKVRLIINKGNDDPPVLEETIKNTEFVEFPNEKIVWVDDKHEMLSLGYSNITPWNLPGDISEEEIKIKLDKLIGDLTNVGNSIFNIHVPPYNTLLDIAPKLDASLKPVLAPGGEPEFVHVGSTAVREAIEELKPLSGLHGHIHESRGYMKIGRTHCFNPGSEYQIGVLKGVILNLSDDKLDNHLLTTG